MLIGGYHEDFYDPDHCVYNDVAVLSRDERRLELYAYPRSVLPPLDSHAAAFVPSENAIFIVGGYRAPEEGRGAAYGELQPTVSDRSAGMPVLRLEVDHSTPCFPRLVSPFAASRFRLAPRGAPSPDCRSPLPRPPHSRSRRSRILCAPSNVP